MLLKSKLTSASKVKVRIVESAESKKGGKCKVSKLEISITHQLNRRFKGAKLIFFKYLHREVTTEIHSHFPVVLPWNEGKKEGKKPKPQNTRKKTPLNYDITMKLSFIFTNSTERVHEHPRAEAEKFTDYFNTKFQFWHIYICNSNT